VFLDGDGRRITHIFRRGGELLVADRGEAVRGKWEYMPATNSLLIEYDGRLRIYKQGFVDPGILALKKEDAKDLFVLVNENRIPDLDVERYLQGLTTGGRGSIPPGPRSKVQTIDLKRPQITIVVTRIRGNVYDKGNLVMYPNGAPLANGRYETKGNLRITVKDGKIIYVDDYNLAISTSTILVVLLILCVVIFIMNQ
jgi:hypothetical protein